MTTTTVTNTGKQSKKHHMDSSEERTKAKNRRNIKANVVSQLSGMNLVGEIITWNTGSGVVTHKQVKQALRDAELDDAIARELLPRHAFSRACKKLADERLIDVVNEDADEIKFQFTKKVMDLANEEWKFQKETYLTLNKTTGTVACKNTDLQKKAQDLLNKCMEERTTSDITKIVQRLFEDQADLFPIRDQGGVYFVFQHHVEFVSKVEKFLGILGGYIMRFPVPSGTQQGDSSIVKSVEEHYNRLIDDHELAVKQFTINTRKDTIENAAKKISDTRVKIEAHAHLLRKRAEDLMKKVDECKEHLQKEVERLAGIRASAPITSGANGINMILGHSMTAVIRWMGKNKWDFQKAKTTLHKHDVMVADATIRAQLLAGRKGERGEPANLTEEQIKILNS